MCIVLSSARSFPTSSVSLYTLSYLSSFSFFFATVTLLVCFSSRSEPGSYLNPARYRDAVRPRDSGTTCVYAAHRRGCLERFEKRRTEPFRVERFEVNASSDLLGAVAASGLSLAPWPFSCAGVVEKRFKRGISSKLRSARLSPDKYPGPAALASEPVSTMVRALAVGHIPPSPPQRTLSLPSSLFLWLQGASASCY